MEQNPSGWMHHPSLKNIDPAKLQMLMSFAEQGKGKSQKELLPLLMAAASKSKNSQQTFSAEETDLILNVLKQGRSPEELRRIEQMVTLMQRMRRI